MYAFYYTYKKIKYTGLHQSKQNSLQTSFYSSLDTKTFRVEIFIKPSIPSVFFDNEGASAFTVFLAVK